MSELVITNKDLVDALKENMYLASARNAPVVQAEAQQMGGEELHKKGSHYFWSCRYDVGHHSVECTAQEMGHIRN